MSGKGTSNYRKRISQNRCKISNYKQDRLIKPHLLAPRRAQSVQWASLRRSSTYTVAARRSLLPLPAGSGLHRLTLQCTPAQGAFLPHCLLWNCSPREGWSVIGRRHLTWAEPAAAWTCPAEQEALWADFYCFGMCISDGEVSFSPWIQTRDFCVSLIFIFCLIGSLTSKLLHNEEGWSFSLLCLLAVSGPGSMSVATGYILRDSKGLSNVHMASSTATRRGEES